MNCRQVQEQLADYSAGLIQGEGRQRLQVHLSACETCRQHLQQFRALDQLLTEDQMETDESLVEGIMVQVRAAELLRKWRRRWLLENLGPTVATVSLLWVAMLILQQYLPQWTKMLSAWQVDWELLMQPEWTVGATLGLLLVAGGVAWLTNWLAEALT